jgi:hypothetical protein
MDQSGVVSACPSFVHNVRPTGNQPLLRNGDCTSMWIAGLWGVLINHRHHTAADAVAMLLFGPLYAARVRIAVPRTPVFALDHVP